MVLRALLTLPDYGGDGDREVEVVGEVQEDGEEVSIHVWTVGGEVPSRWERRLRRDAEQALEFAWLDTFRRTA